MSTMSSKKPFVNRVLPMHASRALSTLTLAFSADPVARFLWPEAQSFQAGFARFAVAFGGKALVLETAYALAEYRGTALWLPPEAEPDDAAVMSVIDHDVRPELQPEFFSLMQAMAEHRPREPHWYLPLIGVDPAYQGCGFGSALMAPVLELCDGARVPAYLKATNPRNIPFYERLGFRTTGVIRVGACPMIVPMMREPL